MLKALCALAALLLAAAASGAGSSLELESGAERVAVIELYTSEGCSSCPPADRWLRGLADDPGLWSRFVPLAFHVDYWDYLGWRDRYASADHSDRQRRYARQGGARTVYTPGFFVNGEEWRGWRRGAMPDAARPRVGVLEASVADGRVSLRFVPAAVQERLAATVALLGMGLASDVAAGENGGRRLEHDFVVLATASGKMTGGDAGFAATIALPEVPALAGRGGQLALAAWVTAAGRQEPLQAIGGLLP